MAILLGLAASVSYGVADFLGGLATRRTTALAVVLGSQVVGLAVLVLSLPIVLGERLTAGAAGWGGVSGLIGASGILLLYRGLAQGRMSVVAPTSAVLGASVPVVYGLAIGEDPSGAKLTGVGIAMVAVALVSAVPTRPSGEWGAPRIPRRGLPEAIGAGLAFGAFFLTFNEAGDAGGGAWPLVASRVVSVLALTAVVALGRRPVALPRRIRPAVAATGVLDTSANLFFLIGSRLGFVSIVSVLTSLYPATTVLLARAVLKERMSLTQVAGMGAAAAGILLITLG